jgi:hypothetical protein
MAELQRTPGRHVTRRLEDPAVALLGSGTRNEPGDLARSLMSAHNAAVRAYGSNSGGYVAFDPQTGEVVVLDDEPFPRGTAVSWLSWGVIDEGTAQRLLEMDGIA